MTPCLLLATCRRPLILGGMLLLCMRLVSLDSLLTLPPRWLATGMGMGIRLSLGSGSRTLLPATTLANRPIVPTSLGRPRKCVNSRPIRNLPFLGPSLMAGIIRLQVLVYVVNALRFRVPRALGVRQCRTPHSLSTEPEIGALATNVTPFLRLVLCSYLYPLSRLLYPVVDDSRTFRLVEVMGMLRPPKRRVLLMTSTLMLSDLNPTFVSVPLLCDLPLLCRCRTVALVSPCVVLSCPMAGLPLFSVPVVVLMVRVNLLMWVCTPSSCCLPSMRSRSNWSLGMTIVL